MPLINYNANRIEALGDNRFGGIQRGTLPNITASVTSSCVNFEDTGFISMSGITGGRGPEYNYSLFDVSASAFITQSTAISSAIISNLSNSTYSLNISNEGVFAYTQSIIVSCSAPPNLQIDYLVVGGGSKGGALTLTGGSGGGVLSGSFSLPYRTTLLNTIGLGATTGSDGGNSSISSSILHVSASGGGANGSGGPSFFNVGLGGPSPIGQGGGAGSSQNGGDGVNGASGNGGSGSLWLNGIYYAGGGGGGSSQQFGGGQAGIGGGGQGGGTGSLFDGTDGLGGGAGGNANKAGSGVVIIRYSTGSIRPAFGGNVTQQGGYIYHTFTGSAEFRYAKS